MHSEKIEVKKENSVNSKNETDINNSVNVANEMSKLAEDRLNQLKYLQADFDNYRKKFDKEKEDIINLANEKILKELLIIVDDIDRVINQLENGKVREGLVLIYKNFWKILEKYGLRQIECLGKKFDPNFHEVLIKETSDKNEGIILEEFQKGFILKNKVIRHSQVKVSEEQENNEEKI